MTFKRTLLAAAAALAFTAAHAETLRLTHNVADTTTWQKGAEKFDELLQKSTGGKMKVKIFANSQLTGGDQLKQPDMVGKGAIDFMLTSAINVTPLVPEMAVFSLPYLYSDYKDVDATTTGEPAAKMAEILAKKNIVVLAWGENGFRELTNSKRAVKTPEDLKGLKIRVAGPMYIDVMTDLGANPQQMQWSETLSALQQGVVDGEENPVPILTAQRLYEMQKYLTEWHYSYDPIFLAVSAKKWNAWDDATKEKVKKAAEEAMAYQKQINRENTAAGLEKLKSEGMEIYKPSAEELAQFKAAVKPAFDKWSAKVGTELTESFEKAINNAK